MECEELEAIDLARGACRALQLPGVRMAAVALSTACPQEEHANHSTFAFGASEVPSASAARAFVRKLRQMADELEAKFCPPGSES